MLRKLLAWMLLLALPLQGLAAGALGSCHAAAGMAMSGAVELASAQAEPVADVPCHAEQAASDVPACSACAACCTAAPFPVPAQGAIPAAPHTSPAVVSVPAPASAWALPLERPPRSDRA